MCDEWGDELTVLQSIYDEIDIISETCVEIPFRCDSSNDTCSLRGITFQIRQNCVGII